MSRADQRMRAAQGIPFSRNQFQREPVPVAAPSIPRCSCGRVHSADELATNHALAERGILEARDRDDGEFLFRGDTDQLPKRIGFMIAPEVNAALADRQWHRVRFARIPGSRRCELQLYPASLEVQ